MNPSQIVELINRTPFRSVEIATTSGDHYVLRDEADFFHNPRRRPELFVLFTEDGFMRVVDADQIVSVTIV